MAIIRDKSIIFSNLSGKIGELVFKQYEGAVVVTKVPNMSNRVLSEKQVKRNEKLTFASVASKNLIADVKRKYALAEVLGVPPNKVYRALVAYHLKYDGDDVMMKKIDV
ncbi:hypothetical protein [Flavihumibacter petaseus]|uniref:Uncharacterized protein n=1 Tax=Flavihumibacter petaseus NBRC 106054 TaxID=1220578 RepID=A0A0E9MWS0_9BACT|nr:hypothetical protein [Flavihumibacter petaseus]GAO42034.1 hypothetical protein FPE01S_01_10470 [Flavihumibacter petaseus NBRC 106054]